MHSSTRKVRRADSTRHQTPVTTFPVPSLALGSNPFQDRGGEKNLERRHRLPIQRSQRRPAWWSTRRAPARAVIAFLSSLTRTTAPSRTERMIGSSASERSFLAYQSQH
jgi:hypothetical protein